MNTGGIVLVHGWGMHAGSWGDFAHAVARFGPVRAPELPGHGRRAGIDLAATVDAWAEDLLSQAQGETWLGWSLGGQLALRAARNHPGRIRRLILLGAAASFVTRPDWPWGTAAEMLEDFAAEVSRDPAEALRRFNRWQVAGAQHARGTLGWLNQQVEVSPPGASALSDGLQLLHDMDLREDLDKLDLPVLLLAGAEDRVVPPEAVQRTAEAIPGARFELVPGAGHAAFHSHPEGVLTAIEGFLARERAA